MLLQQPTGVSWTALRRWLLLEVSFKDGKVLEPDANRTSMFRTLATPIQPCMPSVGPL
jgi:hypothetical protein